MYDSIIDVYLFPIHLPDEISETFVHEILRMMLPVTALDELFGKYQLPKLPVFPFDLNSVNPPLLHKTTTTDTCEPNENTFWYKEQTEYAVD